MTNSTLKRAGLRWWCAVLLVGTLLLALVPLPVAPVPEAQAQASLDCDGSTTADYNGPCGPSFTVPRWSDGSGWDQPQYYETITLGDFDGDGADELLARAATGFVINKWNKDYGQWIDMGAQSFPNGSDAASWTQPQYYATIQAAELGYNGGTAASLLMNSPGGIIAFQWDGKQSWSWLPSGPGWGSGWSDASYYATIQTWGNWLIGRGGNGMQTWRLEGTEWKQLTGASGSVFSDADGWNQPQFYETIKLVDLSGDGTPELVGRGSNGMQVFSWNGSTWAGGDSSGFFTNAQGWDQPQHYQTLTYGDLDGKPGDELLGRGVDGMLDYHWNGTGWEQLTLNPGLFPDNQNWTFSFYYQTIELVELEVGRPALLSARNWAGMLGYSWNASSGEWSETFSGPALADDLLATEPWAWPSHYGTIKYGDIDGDGIKELIARGQFGVRTWKYDGSSNTWGRPLAYGFRPYSDSGQQAAFELANAFLNITGGSTIRSIYTSLDSEVGQNYQTCLNYSLTTGQPLPPTETCYVVGPAAPLANPHNVTAEQWTAMVHTLQMEVAMAEAVNGYFNQSLAAILNDIFAGDQNSIASISNQLAIDASAQGQSASGTWFSLFIGMSEAFINMADPGWQVTVDGLGAAFAALASISSPNSSGFNGAVSQVQAQLTANNTAVIDQNNAAFQYVAQDYGLLYTVGTLVNNQTWLITANTQNDMVSVGRWHFATWTYQTLLPTIWAVMQHTCQSGGGGDCPPADFLSAYDIGSAGDGLDWVRYLYDKASEGILAGNDPALVKMFSAVQSGCYLSDGQGAWSYANCNLGLDRADLFKFQNGWSFDCHRLPGGLCPDTLVEAVAPHSAADDSDRPAPVNPGSSDVFHAAVLSSATFDARTIDPTTVTLAGAPVIGWWVGDSDLNPDGTAYWPDIALSDDNNDGLIDVLLNFHQAEMQLQAGDTEAYLEGRTVSGAVFAAPIPVTVVGAQ